MTDPIADFLTRIRNAQLAGQREVSAPYSKLKYALAQLFEREGWIAGLATQDQNSILKVLLKYESKRPIINQIKRVSRPGRRVYADRHHLPNVLNGLGTAVISTSQGLMTSQDARKQRLGGEVLCEIS